ncbi:MAG: DNA starvation/stationary phase protection protein Dps [Myxococcota bacterium]
MSASQKTFAESAAAVTLHPTKHDQSESITRPMVGLLNECLAEAIDLHWQAKQAHWNVKGPAFIGLHELFDTVATNLNGHADLIAERAIMLGGQAEGTIQVAARRTTLPAYPLHTTDQQAHVDALSSGLAAFGANLRHAIAAAEEAGDRGTADLFTEVSRSIDKDTWFVEAHLGRS